MYWGQAVFGLQLMFVTAGAQAVALPPGKHAFVRFALCVDAGKYFRGTLASRDAMPRGSAGMNLHVLVYNMKRAIKRPGIGGLIDALRAYALYLLCRLRGYCEKTIGDRRFNASIAACA